MKARYLFLIIMMAGYWAYLHEFQPRALSGLDDIKKIYSTAIDYNATEPGLARIK